MIVKPHGRNVAIALSLAVAAGAGIRFAEADSYTASINTAAQVEVQGSGLYYGTYRFTAEGSVPGGANYSSYGVLDFNGANLTNGTTTGLPLFTEVTGVNSMTLNLTDLDDGFAAGGTIDVYLTSNNTAVANLQYQTQASSQPQGIGSQLANLYNVGNFTYAPAHDGGSNQPGSSNNTQYNTTFTLSPAAQQYVVSQLNSGGNLRVVVAAGDKNVAGDFYGEGASHQGVSHFPTLNFNLTTSTFTQANSTLTIGGSKAPSTVYFDRVCVGGTATANLTLTNSGTDAGLYTVSGLPADSSNPQSATGTGTAGTDPVAGNNGTSTVSVGISPVGANAGFGPASATVVIHDQSNPLNDPDINVTLTANQTVANRYVNNVGNTAGVNFANGMKGMLGGTSANQTVTFTTTNTGVPDFSYNSLTELKMAGNASLSNANLTSAPTGVTDTASIAADPGNADAIFGAPGGDGTETTSRNVTFSPGTAKGGLYGTNKYYDGYLALPMVQMDSAIGASSNSTARVYFTTDVYQPANVTSNSTGNVVTLTNAPHTANYINSTLGDIGARASAQVTSVSLTNAQTGWSVDPGLIANATIGDGQTVNAASFNTTGKLNGVYTGKLVVGLQNEQDLTGAAPNDLGTSNISLSTTVSTNSGNGSANILAGGSFAGYYINSNLAKNTTITFLGGTSTAGNNVSVNWAGGVNTTLSDKATVGLTASDTYVLQMSYDPAALTNGTSSPTLGSLVGGHFVQATYGNTGGTAAEVIGAYSGQTALGTYGIDTTNHVVWAVVNSAGDFESIQRMLGDVNGDGHVDSADLNAVLSNFGSHTALWSKGNFDGASTVDLTDLAYVLNNFGSSAPTASVASGSVISAAPEPASLGVLALGMACLLKRRR